MSGEQGRGLWSALAWFVFPVIPVVLARLYHDSLWVTVDPYVWTWPIWLIEIGPLAGFGFLAGATLRIPDEPSHRRWPWRWLSRRSLWVAVGPWSGFLVLAATLCLYSWLMNQLPVSIHERMNAALEPWNGGWLFWALGWIVTVVFWVTFTNGWLWPGFAAVRRARRIGLAISTIKRGVLVAVGFVGSLFGSFWAITQLWRDYFFDTRIVPVILLMGSLMALSGCASTVTYGEVRRRELFAALLVSWTFGLALGWRWLSRRRPKPPASTPPV
jgi:hypothetical protein